jgi:hypothetical protein
MFITNKPTKEYVKFAQIICKDNNFNKVQIILSHKKH